MHLDRKSLKMLIPHHGHCSVERSYNKIRTEPSETALGTVIRTPLVDPSFHVAVKPYRCEPLRCGVCVTAHETLEHEPKPRIGPHILPKFRRAPRAHKFPIKFREILSRAMRHLPHAPRSFRLRLGIQGFFNERGSDYSALTRGGR